MQNKGIATEDRASRANRCCEPRGLCPRFPAED